MITPKTPSENVSGKLSRRSFLLQSSAMVLVLTTGSSARNAQAAPAGALKAFSTPAFIRDLGDDPAKQKLLNTAWNINANGWTQQAIRGNPFTGRFASDQTYYYNPLETDITGGLNQKVSWTAFPNRIIFYFPDLTSEQRYQFADLGYITTGPVPEIPSGNVVCARQTGQRVQGAPSKLQFGPYGPRGWLDEYCELAVTREGYRPTGKITRVDFVCENPEYWYTLWSIDPDRAVQIYRKTLDRPQVKLDDLILKDDAGNTVTDPSTGRPAYNPLNKWNSGTHRLADSGGAMHLTSTPNTLQTELGLAGAATVLRNQGNANGSDLICCSQYGQIFRNSDPHIGQISNQIVGFKKDFRVSLANPIGLYIQMPDFTSYTLPEDQNLPAGAKPEDCWQILRGQKNLPGFPPNFNFLLHTKFEIPESWRRAGVKFEVGDIMIDDVPIKYGSQILPTFQVALFPRALAAQHPQDPQPCLVSLDAPFAKAYPQQIMYWDLWAGYNSVDVPNARGVAMTLASNTIIVAPRIKAGTTAEFALTGSAFNAAPSLPAVNFHVPGSAAPDVDITVEVLELRKVNYAVPGNSEPGPQQLLKLKVTVADGATLGQRDVSVTNAGATPAGQAPFFLWVEPA